MEQNQRNILAYQKKYGREAGKRRGDTSVYGYLAESDGFGSRPNLLMSTYNAWNSLRQWREDIRRNERFVYGDQHADKIYDWKTGLTMTEREMFQRQGLQPSQYNIIRNVMRTISGFWASNKTLPTCIAQKDENHEESEILTATLHALYRKNELWKLDIAELIQLLITGLAIVRSDYVNRDSDSDVVNDYIDPFTFFIDNDMKDPRYADCTFMGCFHDMSVDDVAGMFAKGSRERSRRIRELYTGLSDEERLYEFAETFTTERIEKDFFLPEHHNQGLCRVIEVWRKESAECYWVHDHLKGTLEPNFTITEKELKAENARRYEEQSAMGVAEDDMLLLEWEWKRNNFWKFYYLTPWGNVLDEGINPFWHERPPFIFEIHEFFIGKIYPFIKDLIDANKQINKLSAIAELLTKYSAKSLLFFPKKHLENSGMSVEDVQAKMTDYDAVIEYDAQQGVPPPHYVNTVSDAFGPLNVVQMYLKLSEQVSGVFGALQGQAPPAGTPAQSFLQQSQNSATSLVGIFEAINSFRVRRDKMNVQLMQQFYKGKRWIFDKETGKRLLYDENRVKNIDVEIAIVENTNTPAYRLMVNDILMQLKQFDVNNMIDLRGLIEVGNWPFKDKLLDYLNGREQEMQEAMAQQQGMMPQPGGLPPELAQEMGQYAFAPEVAEQLAQFN